MSASSRLAAAGARALAAGSDVKGVVLVEGVSDQVAVETLAARRVRDLDAEGTFVVPMGGAQAIAKFVAVYGPNGRDVTLAGLCDAAEEHDFRNGLTRAGLTAEPGRDGLAAHGFYVCDADLEDELIRALGIAKVEQVIEAEHELVAWQTLQRQPAQQGRTIQAQLRRFMGTRSGRKIRYARLLVEALDLENVPRPLDAVLDAV